MDSIVPFNYSTTLSILKLILTFQEYRLAYIYNTVLTVDISSKASELAWYHAVPTYLIDLDKIELFVRRKTGEPILNVFLIDNSSDIYKITQVKGSLQPNDITAIFFNSPTSNVDQVQVQRWMKLSIKVLILWKTYLISVHQFGDERIDKILIHPYNGIATKQFVQDYLTDIKNAGGAQLTIFMYHLPPKSTVGPVYLSDNYTFNGPDGVISDLLFKSLNVTTTYVTDMAIRFPDFDQWKKNPGIAARLPCYNYHQEATTTNMISKFNVTANSTMDFYMTPQIVDEDDINVEFNTNTERLYPHDTDCLLVIVPKQQHTQNFLKTVIRHGDIQSICCAFLLFALVRIAIQRPNLGEWFSVTFRTLQLFLNQGHIFNRNEIEATWTNILRGFSVIAVATMSAILYKSLVNVQPRQIDTIADLIASNLTIFIPASLASQFDDLTTNLELHKSSIVVPEDKFGSAFLTGEMNSAYVCLEEYALFLMKMKSIFQTGNVQSHAMKEKLYCRLNSYRINKSSPFKRIANDFVRRCFENGLYGKVHDWAVRLSDTLFAFKITNSEQLVVVIKFEVIASVFHWYLKGMLTSLVVLMLEICVRKCTQGRRAF